GLPVEERRRIGVVQALEARLLGEAHDVAQRRGVDAAGVVAEPLYVRLAVVREAAVGREDRSERLAAQAAVRRLDADPGSGGRRVGRRPRAGQAADAGLGVAWSRRLGLTRRTVRGEHAVQNRQL